jgi:superfamily II DNA or RNA helicase
MPRLEDLKPGTHVRGLAGSGEVRLIQVVPQGSDALVITYKDDDAGRTDDTILFGADLDKLQIVSDTSRWSFDADATHFVLASEARRMQLAHLFDPYLAVNTSAVEPLPHQIEAVYFKFLPRQQLRYVLADDPGAGKTIMAGLFCKELMLRGDVQRCLIIAPGSLVEQWQEEMWQKFQLRFAMLTRDQIEGSLMGNPFAENNLLIARMDHLSRNEILQSRLRTTDWDLIVIDEAHKLSAQRFGSEVKRTKRYELGLLAGAITRHLLLMTATPHNGKEEDFQLFMQLIDRDRFEGKPKAGQKIDVSDVMRRVMKESLLKFDGKPLFQKRFAYTATYPLSPLERDLYDSVTDYVRSEMTRADKIGADGNKRRGNVIGFALTTLQRRLASSPEAIYQSLCRRRKRLEERMRVIDERSLGPAAIAEFASETKYDSLDDDFDPDDLSDSELEGLEDEVVDEATTARTREELEAEIFHLKRLEERADRLRSSRTDRKWSELAQLLETAAEMRDEAGNRRKLIIFTEHKDTLHYLVDRLDSMIFGRQGAVVAIHGSIGREERRKAQYEFVHNPDVLVLVATDAAGEGVNLQRANLMVNYDLPWNPNRIEQRFGRIHRIGQTEPCFMWSLVAEETREGAVYQRLFDKLAQQRETLGDVVFDVLGLAFTQPLRELLIKAIREGERPEVRDWLNTVIDASVGDHLKTAWQARRLVGDVIPDAELAEIREDMDRARAQKLQPHFISSFFREAFGVLGGTIREREPRRWEVTHVPSDVRGHGTALDPIGRKYERVTFERELTAVAGRPPAELCCPGSPLFDGVSDEVVNRWGALLRCGAVLVDRGNSHPEPRLLVYLDHEITDAHTDNSGQRRVVSRKFEFVEVGRDGSVRGTGPAPYTDYSVPTAAELADAAHFLRESWVQENVEEVAASYAIGTAIPTQLAEVRRRTDARVAKTIREVQTRLDAEIRYWDNRANQLKDQELAGKQPSMNSGRARERADDLLNRRDARIADLDKERLLTPRPPRVVGAALIVPAALLGSDVAPPGRFAVDLAARMRVDKLAVDAAMKVEEALGRDPKEMPHNNKGYDIESRCPDGSLIHVEVKGRAEGAPSITITHQEIMTALSADEKWRLALVSVASDDTTTVRYLRNPRGFLTEPTLFTESVTLNLSKLQPLAEAPS